MLKSYLVLHSPKIAMVTLKSMYHYEKVYSFSLLQFFFHKRRLDRASLLDSLQHFLAVGNRIAFFEYDWLYLIP
jgi:hypothetical protein